jgi:hypothetical protein
VLVGADPLPKCFTGTHGIGTDSSQSRSQIEALFRIRTGDPLLTMEVSRRHARPHAITRDTVSPANRAVAGSGHASRDVARVVSDVSVLCPRVVVFICHRGVRSSICAFVLLEAAFGTCACELCRPRRRQTRGFGHMQRTIAGPRGQRSTQAFPAFRLGEPLIAHGPSRSVRNSTTPDVSCDGSRVSGSHRET